MKFTFEKTSFGFQAYANGVYFGHFYTKQEAKQVFSQHHD